MRTQTCLSGRLAQLGERSPYKRGVQGSSPWLSIREAGTDQISGCKSRPAPCAVHLVDDATLIRWLR